MGMWLTLSPRSIRTSCGHDLTRQPHEINVNASEHLTQAILQPRDGSPYGPFMMKDPYLFLAALDHKVFDERHAETGLDRDRAYETCLFVSDSTAQMRIKGVKGNHSMKVLCSSAKKSIRMATQPSFNIRGWTVQVGMQLLDSLLRCGPGARTKLRDEY